MVILPAALAWPKESRLSPTWMPDAWLMSQGEYLPQPATSIFSTLKNTDMPNTSATTTAATVTSRSTSRLRLKGFGGRYTTSGVDRWGFGASWGGLRRSAGRLRRSVSFVVIVSSRVSY